GGIDRGCVRIDRSELVAKTCSREIRTRFSLRRTRPCLPCMPAPDYFLVAACTEDHIWLTPPSPIEDDAVLEPNVSGRFGPASDPGPRGSLPFDSLNAS